jgi:hypothetical protein
MSLRNTAFAALLFAPLVSACERNNPAEPVTDRPQFIVNGTIDTNNTYANVGAFIVKRLSDGQIFRSVPAR